MLRRLSIDELPQIWNVLRGEMSLVGPRPLPVRDYELLDDLHKKRYLVLPGMTGLWQVSGRSDLSFDELVRLDFYYIENVVGVARPDDPGADDPVVLGRRGAVLTAGDGAPGATDPDELLRALRRGRGSLRCSRSRWLSRHGRHGGGPRAPLVSGLRGMVLRLIAPSLGELLGQLERDRHRTRAEIARLEARVAELERRAPTPD